MIVAETFSLEWIQSLKAKLGKRIDPKMIEKVIYALSLLEQLKAENLNLVFKGGTCLLLTSPTPTRFSIDIDIITEHNEADITAALDSIVAKGIFTRWESDNDRKNAPEAPVSHYKVYYTSKVDNSFGDEPILLDVLHATNPYPKTVNYSIEHSWLKKEGESLVVEIPTYDSILGDKLTAFAPKTTGILYSKGRPVEIIKQLYDLGFLFDQISDMLVIKASYQAVVKEELAYRKLDLTFEHVLDDTIEACLKLASRKLDDEEFKHLQKGIINIANFIIIKFKIEEAITAAGKIAYLSLLLKREELTQPEKFTSPEQVKDVTIMNQEYNWLNKLKKSNPEAFFYWDMGATTKETIIEEQDEVVLEDNQLVCLLTGDIKPSKPKEVTLQSVIRMLNEEYGFDITDMRRDFSITGYDADTGKPKKQKIDLVVFDAGKPHEQDFIIRIAIVQDEKIKETDKKNGLEATLQNALNALDSCEFGLWTNGLTYQFLQKSEDAFGNIDYEDLSDFPGEGQTIEDLDRSDKIIARTPANDSLIRVFKRCHDYN